MTSVPNAFRRRVWSAVAVCFVLTFGGGFLAAQEPEKAAKGKVITITGQIDTGLKNRVVNAAKSAAREGAEVLIFDLQSSPTSGFGECLGLAREIAELHGAVKQKIAYIGKPTTGHGLLVALACDEIVMAETAKLGNAYSENPDVEADPVEIQAYRETASAKGHDPWLALTMVQKALRVYQVRTGVGGKRYLPEDKIEEFARTTRIIDRKVVKEIGERKVYDAREARDAGLVKYIAGSLREAAVLYGLSEAAGVSDAPQEETMRPLMLQLHRHIDGSTRNYVNRQLRQAVDRRCNLLFVEVDSASGDEEAAENIANMLVNFPGRTVAFVPNEATGASVLILFGCKELVVGQRAKIGGFRAGEGNLERRADGIAELASKGRFSEAVVRRFIDPGLTVFEVRNKQNRNMVAYRTDKQLADPETAKEWEKSRPGPIEDHGPILTLDSERAVSLEIAVDRVGSVEELYKHYGVKEAVPVLQPGWVDALVEALTSNGGTVFLLSAGMLLLYLELQFPGFLLPGVLAGVCFVLFFWSRWLADQPNSLAIVLFLLGLGLLAIEMFVIPGFGIMGVSGMMLILTSLVLASQSFTIPRTEAEVGQMMGSLGRVGAALAIFVVAAATLSRFLPRLPIFDRFVLAPPTEGSNSEPDDAPASSELLGVTGIASSTLRPAGRMQVGDELLDVVAQGEFIEAGTAIEIIEVHRHRIVVKAV